MKLTNGLNFVYVEKEIREELENAKKGKFQMTRLTNGLNFVYVEKEIREELEEYKKQLLKSETRKNALCEYYHAMAVSWNDCLQYAENIDDADFIKAKVKLNEEISERYL